MNTITQLKPRLSVIDRPDDTELVTRWLSTKAKTTQEVYQGAIAQLREWTDGAPLLTLNSLDLEAYQVHLGGLGLANATIRNKLSYISSFYSWAVKHDIVKRNPCCALDLPKQQDTLIERILTKEQVREIFAAAENERDRLFLKCLYYLGLRVSEAVAIRAGDILPGEPHRLRIVGKGEKNRYENIHPKILKPLQARAKEVSKFGGDRYGAQYHLFPFKRKRGWAIVKAAVELVAPEASPHWLRHAYATHALQAGADIELVRRSLGHANIATTSKYLHALPGASASDFLD